CGREHTRGSAGGACFSASDVSTSNPERPFWTPDRSLLLPLAIPASNDRFHVVSLAVRRGPLESEVVPLEHHPARNVDRHRAPRVYETGAVKMNVWSCHVPRSHLAAGAQAASHTAVARPGRFRRRSALPHSGFDAG